MKWLFFLIFSMILLSGCVNQNYRFDRQSVLDGGGFVFSVDGSSMQECGVKVFNFEKSNPGMVCNSCECIYINQSANFCEASCTKIS